MKNIVIVDIDGTISKVGDRVKYLQQEPKDWDSFYSACFEDEPIREIIDLVRKLEEVDNDSGWADYDVRFCTGRRECVRDITEKWIKQHFGYHSIFENTLLMRKDGDLRHDTEVKPELLREAGIDFNEIAFVIEDRNSMVKKWRGMGLICLQPFEGDF